MRRLDYAGKLLGEPARQAALAWLDRPAQEIWDELVADGIIDQEGNVLISKPYLDSDVVPGDDDDRPASAP